MTYALRAVNTTFISTCIRSTAAGSFASFLACTSSSAVATSSRRSIRTLTPPRPLVTVISYLDHYGNPVKTKQETDLSLIRTRDNKFFLQRVFDDESVVRFACPGLAMIKNAANFEYFSMQDIDVYGGVLIPSDVFPSAAHDRPCFHDAVYVIMRCQPTAKFTRKDRRAWHRRLHAHWEEDPEKYKFQFMSTFTLFAVACVYFGFKYINAAQRGVPFLNEDAVPFQADSYWAKAARFAERHPEHLSAMATTLHFSPAQAEYIQARSEIRGSESIDPSMSMEFVWKVQHLKQYGHWPKGLAE